MGKIGNHSSKRNHTKGGFFFLRMVEIKSELRTIEFLNQMVCFLKKHGQNLIEMITNCSISASKSSAI